jgi:hypothetical protein
MFFLSSFNEGKIKQIINWSVDVILLSFLSPNFYCKSATYVNIVKVYIDERQS